MGCFKSNRQLQSQTRIKYLKWITQINFTKKKSLNNLDPNLSLKWVPTNNPGEVHIPFAWGSLESRADSFCVFTHTGVSCMWMVHSETNGDLHLSAALHKASASEGCVGRRSHPGSACWKFKHNRANCSKPLLYVGGRAWPTHIAFLKCKLRGIIVTVQKIKLQAWYINIAPTGKMQAKGGKPRCVSEECLWV